MRSIQTEFEKRIAAPKMKHILYFVLTVFMLSESTAQDLSETPGSQLEQIVELFLKSSTEDARNQLEASESDLVAFTRVSGDAGMNLLLARAYFYAEMDQKAIDQFNEALERDPSLSDAHFFLGLINRYARDLEGAVASFSSAIEINNREKKYFIELARTLAMNNEVTSAISAYQNALALGEADFDSNFNLARLYAIAGNANDAEFHFLAAIEQSPSDIDSHYNLGQLYQANKRHEAAILRFEKVIELKPNEWRAIAKIVQESEALNDHARRDSAIESIYRVWRSNADIDLTNQGFYIRDQIDVEGGKLFALEYFELEGERPRKFVFNLQDPQTGDFVFSVSLGSYASTNEFARATGEVAAGGRIYHLDGYAPNGNHYTYAFFNTLPSYSLVKELALKALAGELKASSSTTVRD